MRNTHEELVIVILFYSGGIQVVFSGSNLNVTQSPMIVINDSRFESTQGVSAILLICVAHMVDNMISSNRLASLPVVVVLSVHFLP